MQKFASGLLMDFNRAAFILDTEAAFYSVNKNNPELSGGFSSICIDSRQVKAGALFIALAGEKTDGHRFVEAAFKAGAAGALVELKKIDEYALAPASKILLPCENTLYALQKLAAAHLDELPRLLRIGITGSSGKTTTKEIALSIFCREKQVIANKGNLNSETGLPLSVFEAGPEHEAGIFEAGMNRKNEIAELARVLRPQIALITNIGSAHIGKIGSLEAVANEKKAIFSAFTGNETALIDKGDGFSSFLAEGVNGKVLFYGDGTKIAAAHLKAEPLGLLGWNIEWQGKKLRFPLPGVHNLKNALAAAALAQTAEISDTAIIEGLADVKPLFGRAEIISNDGITVVRDCYNANPESAAAAITLCDELDWCGKRIYVLGDMLELGGESESAHKKLGEHLARSKADFIFLFGNESAAALNPINAVCRNVLHTNNIDTLRSALKKQTETGTLVLLKGSRGCALERAM